MGVKITGLKSLQVELEARFGQAKMQEISDQALLGRCGSHQKRTGAKF